MFHSVAPVQRPDAPPESEPDVLVIADEVIDISEEDQEISDAFSGTVDSPQPILCLIKGHVYMLR